MDNINHVSSQAKSTISSSISSFVQGKMTMKKLKKIADMVGNSIKKAETKWYTDQISSFKSFGESQKFLKSLKIAFNRRKEIEKDTLQLNGLNTQITKFWEKKAKSTNAKSKKFNGSLLKAL